MHTIIIILFITTFLGFFFGISGALVLIMGNGSNDDYGYEDTPPSTFWIGGEGAALEWNSILLGLAVFVNGVMCVPCIPNPAKSFLMGTACILGAIPPFVSTSSRFGLGDAFCMVALLLRAAAAVGYCFLYCQEHQEKKQQALPLWATKPVVPVSVPVLAAAVVNV